MENTVKPNFVQESPTSALPARVVPPQTVVGADSSVTVPTTAQEVKNNRKEYGAIWERQARTGMNFLTLKVNYSRAELVKLLATTTSDEVTFNLVAFPNKNKEGQSNRPSYRIYESIKNN